MLAALILGLFAECSDRPPPPPYPPGCFPECICDEQGCSWEIVCR